MTDTKLLTLPYPNPNPVLCGEIYDAMVRSELKKNKSKRKLKSTKRD